MTIRDSLAQVQAGIARADGIIGDGAMINLARESALDIAAAMALAFLRTHGPELMKRLDRHGAGDAEDLEQFRAAVLSWKDDVEWLTWANRGESAIEAQKQVDEANRLIGLIDAQKAARAGERGVA